MSVAAEHPQEVHTHSGELSEASIGQLTSRLSEQVSRLVRDELALAELEAKKKAAKLGIGMGMLVAAGVLGLLGAGAGIACAILAVHLALSAWLSALVIMGGLFVLAGMVALAGAVGLRKGSPPLPSEAIASTKADLAVVRHAVKRSDDE